MTLGVPDSSSSFISLNYYYSWSSWLFENWARLDYDFLLFSFLLVLEIVFKVLKLISIFADAIDTPAIDVCVTFSSYETLIACKKFSSYDALTAYDIFSSYKILTAYDIVYAYYTLTAYATA